MCSEFTLNFDLFSKIGKKCFAFTGNLARLVDVRTLLGSGYYSKVSIQPFRPQPPEGALLL